MPTLASLQGLAFARAATLALLASATACGDAVPSEPADVAANELLIVQGTVGTVGERAPHGGCRVGVVAVTAAATGAAATLSIASLSASPASRDALSTVDVSVRAGQLVPLCAGFHRVTDVRTAGRGAVVLEREALATGPRWRPEADSLVLIEGAVAQVSRVVPGAAVPLRAGSARLLGLTAGPDGAPLASFDVQDLSQGGPGPQAAAPTTPGRLVKAGETLVIGGRPYRVRGLWFAPPDAALPGFADLGAASPAP
jgi:hypothetical protein